MTSMKAFVKAEKKLACDLRPGELFVMPDEDGKPPNFEQELNGDNVAIPVLLRTNVSDVEHEDREMVVYKLAVIVASTAPPTEARIDPHKPPGVRGEF